jgi:hypothetical protein
MISGTQVIWIGGRGAVLKKLLLGGFAALGFIATADCIPAFASPGCDAVNGGAFTASATAVPGKTGTEITIANFAVGDTVTFNIVIVPGSGNPQWHLGAGSNDLNLLAAVASSTQTYTVTGNLVGGGGHDPLATCVHKFGPRQRERHRNLCPRPIIV